MRGNGLTLKIAGILLAAGRSSRFGDADKLTAPLWGQPLVCHAGNALAETSANPLFVVTGSAKVANALPQYHRVQPKVNRGLSESLHAGVLQAEKTGADAVLVVLGDLPWVTSELLERLIELADPSQPAAASDGRRAQVPALFPRACFGELKALQGDRGAGKMLQSLSDRRLVTVDPRFLRDINYREDLSLAEKFRA